MLCIYALSFGFSLSQLFVVLLIYVWYYTRQRTCLGFGFPSLFGVLFGVVLCCIVLYCIVLCLSEEEKKGLFW